MKIAFTGASGTGKTSVAKELLGPHQTSSHNLKLVGVDSRGLLDTLGLRRAESINGDQYKVFQTMYLAQKLLSEAQESSFLTERSFADGLAYWKMHCEKSASSEENIMIESLCCAQSKNYDLHFLFPTGFLPLEDDGYRHGSPEYHKEFEILLRSIFQAWDVKVLVMPMFCVKSRAQFILENIS